MKGDYEYKNLGYSRLNGSKEIQNFGCNAGAISYRRLGGLQNKSSLYYNYNFFFQQLFKHATYADPDPSIFGSLGDNSVSS